jgi:PAS domain-containing protein
LDCPHFLARLATGSSRRQPKPLEVILEIGLMSIRVRRLLQLLLTPAVSIIIALLLTRNIAALRDKGSLFVFLAAFVVSLRLGGWIAGLLAIVFAGAVIAFFLSAPLDSFAVRSSSDLIRLGIFALISLVILSQHASRAKVEADLVRSEQRLMLSLDSAHMGVWDYNLITRQFWWSKTLELIFNRADGSFPDTYGQFFACVHFDDQPLFNRAITRTIDEGTDYDVDHRIMLPDGSSRWVNTRGRVFFNQSNRAERIVGVATDITAKKKIEQQKQQSIDHMDAPPLESSLASSNP